MVETKTKKIIFLGDACSAPGAAGQRGASLHQEHGFCPGPHEGQPRAERRQEEEGEEAPQIGIITNVYIQSMKVGGGVIIFFWVSKWP